MWSADVVPVMLGIFVIIFFLNAYPSIADDPYRFYTWTATYGTASPLGTPQKVILINGQFPGPMLNVMTNDNIIINLFNELDESFLLTWNGIKQRKNSWQDGVLGTNCPIPPKSNFTYKIQAKDQIGTYTYFPSTFLHKANGGYGSFNIYSRPQIPVPYATPAANFSLLIGDWHKLDHKALRKTLDAGKNLPFPDGLIINGGNRLSPFVGDAGKTYMFKVSNVGMSTSINFRIEGHSLKLVEVEGSHVIQNFYDSLDVHVGQSVAVLVTLNQPPKDYYIVASSRFTRSILTTTALLRYRNSNTPVSGSPPTGPTYQIRWSVLQARTFRWNLTASAARPNPQGSYHYGKVKFSKTVIFSNSAPLINGKRRYAVNDVSYVNPETPLKLADHFGIPGVFTPDSPQEADRTARIDTPVMKTSLHDFVEIVFQNDENIPQSWHLDGYDFWVVSFGFGNWSTGKRRAYNLVDAPTRHTVQVYPKGWTAILVSLDNQGMWNLRSAVWERQYLGQQLYIRVHTEKVSQYNEYNMPTNALLCGKAAGRN